MKTSQVKNFLSPKQAALASFVTDNRYFVLCEGAFRSGKTFVVSFYFFFFTQMLKRPYHHLVLGKNRGVLEAEVLPKFRLLAQACGLHFHYTRYDGTATIGKQVYHVIAGNDERDKERLYGYTMHSMFCTEVTRVPEDFFKAATTRLTFEGGKIFADCNPEGPQHWVKKDWIDTGLVDCREHFTFEDNPILSEAKKLQFRRQYSGVFARRMVDGVWAEAEGRIYPVYHTPEGIEGMERPSRIDVGVDYGSASPSAVAVLAQWENLAILTECQLLSASPTKNRTDASLANEVEEIAWRVGAASIVLDPSAVSLRAELRRRKAENSFLRKEKQKPRNWAIIKGKNDLLPGIRFLASELEHGGIKVAPGDQNKDFRREQQGYSWDDDEEDTPIEVDAHVLAAFRYVSFTRWRRRRRAATKPRGA